MVVSVTPALVNVVPTLCICATTLQCAHALPDGQERFCSHHPCLLQDLTNLALHICSSIQISFRVVFAKTTDQVMHGESLHRGKRKPEASAVLRQQSMSSEDFPYIRRLFEEIVLHVEVAANILPGKSLLNRPLPVDQRQLAIDKAAHVPRHTIPMLGESR